jgi:hypothetical protein
MITVPAAIFNATLDQLASCGRGRHECVAFWTGQTLNDVVDSTVHPEHASSAASYRVDDDWLNRFWFSLHEQRRRILAQVHTHPGAAFHSTSDDEGAIGVHPGFLSIVIPQFAANRSLLDACAYRMTNAGWQRVSLDAAVRIL